MKLMFLLYDFYPNFSANSLIINHLAKAFSENGHEVHILPMTASSDFKSEEKWEQLQIHRITKCFDKKQVVQFIHGCHFVNAVKLAVAIHIDSYQKKEYQKTSWSYYSYKRLRSIIRTCQIDIIINVCYPLEACLPVLKYITHYKKSFQWILYMLDPFATNYYYMSRYPMEDLLNFQSKIFEKADKIIVTSPIMNELKSLNKDTVLDKFQVLNFPKIIRPYISPAVDDIWLDLHYINCIFVGKFNKETRNPLFLFRMFEGLNNERIRLYIIGEERESWSEYLSPMDDHIIFYGTKSREAAVNAQLRANILVNVGNRMNNQLPSKLLEYISMGKPIINFYQRKDCPSLEYMALYPVCLNIYQEPPDDNRILRKLRNFIMHNRRVNISYRYIRNKFYYCTLDYVSSEFLNLFDELMEYRG
jgi:hypothetical protein